jgi:hypothetical protein
MKANAVEFPSSQHIRARMQACRDELSALKRLLRAAEAAEQANEARQRGEQREDRLRPQAGAKTEATTAEFE